MKKGYFTTKKGALISVIINNNKVVGYNLVNLKFVKHTDIFLYCDEDMISLMEEEGFTFKEL